MPLQCLPFLKKKKLFAYFLYPSISHEARNGTHNVRDKALLNVCLPSLTCWDKFHITPSTPGENVIRGLERLHTNKRSVPLSLARHKASIWKWACFFRPGLTGLKHYPSHTGWSRFSLWRGFTKAKPDYTPHPQNHIGNGLSPMETHSGVFVL